MTRVLPYFTKIALSTRDRHDLDQIITAVDELL